MTKERTERPTLELSPEQERAAWRVVEEALRPPPEERDLPGEVAG